MSIALSERASLTKREFGVLHNIPDRSLDRAIADGRLRAAKVLGHWRIRAEDGDRYRPRFAAAGRSRAHADRPPDFRPRSVRRLGLHRPPATLIDRRSSSTRARASRF